MHFFMVPRNTPRAVSVERTFDRYIRYGMVLVFLNNLSFSLCALLPNLVTKKVILNLIGVDSTAFKNGLEMFRASICNHVYKQILGVSA